MKHVFQYEVAEYPHVLDGCLTLDDYIQRLRGVFDHVEGDKESKETKTFLQHGLEALVEVIAIHCGLFQEYEVIPDDGLMVKGIANKDTAIGIYYYDKPDVPLTANRHNLNMFWGNAQMHYLLSKCVIFTNTVGVDEGTRARFFESPIISAKFFGKAEIEALVNDNVAFWDYFRANLFVPPTQLPVKELRGHQSAAVQACREALPDKKGMQKGVIICPTGTGKTLIEAEVVLDAIQDNPVAVCLIATPRIVLTYQLIDEVSTYLASKKVEAQYLNLNSGRFNDVKFKKKMVETGMSASVVGIPSTTSPDELRKHADAAKERGVPLIIGATYQSAYKLLHIFDDGTQINLHTVIADEAHNLVIKNNEKPDGTKKKLKFKQKFHKLFARRKFFFTATPVKDKKKVNGTGGPPTKVRHWGMQNRRLFGKTIFRAFSKDMIGRGEILPPYVHVVEIAGYSHNGTGLTVDLVGDNIDALVDVLQSSFAAHRKVVKEESSDPDSIGAKLLVVCRGEPELAGFFRHLPGPPQVFRSLAMRNFIDANPNVQLYGISTNSGAFIYKDGHFTHYKPSGSSYKEKFMLALREMDDKQDAIIFHIDMIGEGIDVAGITGVMSYRGLGVVKRSQTIGRAMRLCSRDRQKIYGLSKDELHEFIVARDKFISLRDKTGVMEGKEMVKPRCWIIMPKFNTETVKAADEVKRMVMRLRRKYGTPTEWFYSTVQKGGAIINDPPMPLDGFSNIVVEIQHRLEEGDYQRLLKKVRQELKQRSSTPVVSDMKSPEI